MIAYLAFSVPAVLAGLASTAFGLHTTAVVYGLIVVVLGLVAIVAQQIRSQRASKVGAAPGTAVAVVTGKASVAADARPNPRDEHSNSDLDADAHESGQRSRPALCGTC